MEISNHILILWFPEESCGDTPLRRLGNVIDETCKGSTASVKVLGPVNSTMLRAMVDEVNESATSDPLSSAASGRVGAGMIVTVSTSCVRGVHAAGLSRAPGGRVRDVVRGNAGSAQGGCASAPALLSRSCLMCQPNVRKEPL